MKKLLSVFLAVFTLAGARASEDTSPELVSIPLAKAFVPIGFDDNDHVQVVVTGEFPDTCYKLGPVTAKKTASGIEILQQAYRHNGGCLDMMVSFSQVVDLDLLKAGDYEIKDSASGKTIGKLPITVAKAPSPDDYLYAPVEEVMVLEERGGKGPTLYLTGNFPSNRMQIKEVRVQRYNDVVVVQPIMQIVASAGEGRAAAHPRFEVKQSLSNLPRGNFLLHVRSMNGKAVNKMEELD